MSDLQYEIGIWHQDHFPDCSLTRIVLKVCEEAGELAKAHEYRLNSDWPERALTEAEENEIADVAISLMALCQRGGASFEQVVARKWREVKARSAARVKDGGR
ncbi:MAG: hypothetical protein Q7O66_14975 [Dehalococcoidia bacterium]|nr:hypothetical protein [Dehalococcoidia bacterium]